MSKTVLQSCFEQDITPPRWNTSNGCCCFVFTVTYKAADFKLASGVAEPPGGDNWKALLHPQQLFLSPTDDYSHLSYNGMTKFFLFYVLWSLYYWATSLTVYILSHKPSCSTTTTTENCYAEHLPLNNDLYYLLTPSWPGSSVGIATGYGLEGPGIESRWGRDFPHL